MGAIIKVVDVWRTASDMVDYVAGIYKDPKGKIIDSSFKNSQNNGIDEAHCMQELKSHFQELAKHQRKEETVHFMINIAVGEWLSDDKFNEIGTETRLKHCTENSVFIHGRHYDAFHPHSHLFSDEFLKRDREQFMASLKGSKSKKKKAWKLRRKKLVKEAKATNKNLARYFEKKFDLPENTINIYFRNEHYVDSEFSIKETIRKSIDLAIKSSRLIEDFLPKLMHHFKDCYQEFVGNLKGKKKKKILKKYGRPEAELSVYINKKKELIYDVEVFRCKESKLGHEYVLEAIYEKILLNNKNGGSETLDFEDVLKLNDLRDRRANNNKDSRNEKLFSDYQQSVQSKNELNLDWFKVIMDNFRSIIQTQMSSEKMRNEEIREKQQKEQGISEGPVKEEPINEGQIGSLPLSNFKGENDEDQEDDNDEKKDKGIKF